LPDGPPAAPARLGARGRGVAEGAHMNTSNPKTNTELTPFERHVIEDKGTEAPWTGEFVSTREPGTYHCKRCDAALYRSEDKFESNCGWPSFDDEIVSAVRRVDDADGQRVEITCARCDAHLGHVFAGEGHTPKDTRHCVNSISMTFKPTRTETLEKALLASGCFWGTEYHFARMPGVAQTRVGFAGGHVSNPSYKEVCAGTTGHLECVEVQFNPRTTTYEKVLKLFFETHDFGQEDGQGPDIGPQYLSAIFCQDDGQRFMAGQVMGWLRERGHKVATEVRGKAEFFPAEDYHQKYYFKTAKTPYCHVYRKIFP
jgi:peptide methionine sulfoxide reductase msrA/msrB